MAKISLFSLVSYFIFSALTLGHYSGRSSKTYIEATDMRSSVVKFSRADI